MNGKFNHVVETYNLSGKWLYGSSYNNAEDAYKEYCEIIKRSKNDLPKGYGIIVVRKNNGRVMTTETIDNR